MAEGISPGEAAQIAQGATDGANGAADPEPMPTGEGGSSVNGMLEALLQTEPNEPLESVESPWRPDVGGPARVYRGIQKMTNMNGMPAIADIVIGAAEILVDKSESTAHESPDRDNDPDENLAAVIDE